MSQTLLVELMKGVDARQMIVASVKDVADPELRKAHLRELLAAHMEVHGKLSLDSAKEFLLCVNHAGEKSAKMVAGDAAESVVEVVADAYRHVPLSQGDLASTDWMDVLREVIRHDNVHALMALDKAGLVDRSVTGAGSVGQACWEQAFGYGAQRCNRYLLTTSSIADLGGFPAAMDPKWPESLAVARDVIAHVPAPQLETVLIDIDRLARYMTSGRDLKQMAGNAVAAVLERCSEDPVLSMHPVFADLLAAMVAHTIKQDSYRDDANVAAVLLAIMERRGELDGQAAFKFAEIMLSADRRGDVMTPQHLERLLANGLRMESLPEWNEKADAVHLLISASICHFPVLDRLVADREQFMRAHGVAFASSHSDYSSSGVGKDHAIKGVENAAFIALAKLGYPLGPIEVVRDGEIKPLALYERIYRHYAGAYDAFLVGHLVGHLGERHTFDEGSGPVRVAAGCGHIASVEALAAKGLSLEDRGKGSDTPLIRALKKPDEKMVRALIALGADVTVKAVTGATAMQLAKSDDIKQLIRAARTTKAVIATFKDDGEPAASTPSVKKAVRLDPL